MLPHSISQLNKQLVEQQNADPSDRHENGTDTSTSDSQQDSVLLALKEILKIVEVVGNLETAVLEHKRTLGKLLCMSL